MGALRHDPIPTPHNKRCQLKSGRRATFTHLKKCEVCGTKVLGKNTICQQCYAIELSGRPLEPSFDACLTDL